MERINRPPHPPIQPVYLIGRRQIMPTYRMSLLKDPTFSKKNSRIFIWLQWCRWAVCRLSKIEIESVGKNSGKYSFRKVKAVVIGCVIRFLDKLRLTVVSFVIKAATNERVFWTPTNQRLPFTTVKFKQKFLLSEIRNKFRPREFPGNFFKENSLKLLKKTWQAI